MPARARPEPLDVVVAGALTLAAQVEIWAPEFAPGVSSPEGSLPLLAGLSLLMTIPLAFRRVYPLGTCALVLAAACAEHLLTTPTEGLSALAAMLLATYSVAAHGTPRASRIGLGLVLLTSVIVGRDDFLFVLLLLTGAWLVGLVVGRRTHQVADLETERVTLLAERQVAAQRGALEERHRIARELHDVVAHRVSVMVVQAQAADALLETSPHQAREAVRAVDEAGREALEELRSLLGLLRSEPDIDHLTSSLAPTPGLRDIDQLIDDTRQAGLPITVERVGQPRPVPQVIELAAYRVIQESLTNALKHGHQAPTTVRIGFDDDGLDLLIADRGPGASGDTPGFGLAGMHERVNFVGGTLVVGPGVDSGFAVYATLPAPEART